MRTHSRPARNAMLAAAALAIFGAPPAPAFAGTADIELLQSYVGNWKGRGTAARDGEAETVVCKLDISKASSVDKINYKGKCALAGGTLSVAGTMAYVDAKNQFEAVMSSSTSFQGVAVGRRHGGTIDFTLHDRNAEANKEYTIEAGLALDAGDIAVTFKVTEVGSGRTITADVPFRK